MLPFGPSGAWGFGVSKLAFFFTFRIATLGGRRQGAEPFDLLEDTTKKRKWTKIVC